MPSTEGTELGFQDAGTKSGMDFDLKYTPPLISFRGLINESVIDNFIILSIIFESLKFYGMFGSWSTTKPNRSLFRRGAL
jgi:hypothetical protein